MEEEEIENDVKKLISWKVCTIYGKPIAKSGLIALGIVCTINFFLSLDFKTVEYFALTPIISAGIFNIVMVWVFFGVILYGSTTIGYKIHRNNILW